MTASCTLGGYALESQCHTGHRCVYDTVGDKGWRIGIGNHKISTVITSVIEDYDSVPACVPDTECSDCINWKFFKSNGSATSTTRSTASNPVSTRTSVCKTPGWWGMLYLVLCHRSLLIVVGCLDETTTSTTTSGSSGLTTPIAHTTTSTTQSTTSTTQTTTPTTHTTTSCHSWGWFGCKDPITPTENHILRATAAAASQPTSLDPTKAPNWPDL